uniref:FBA_2 domain-containing protein n=1 Tax=Caenorhabditis tropicalis TaxID=1561998 RepID=A0A1I7T3U2_9PELO
MCSKRAKILVQKLGPKYDKAVIDCLNSSIGIQTTGIIRPMEDVVQKVVMFSAKNKPENMHLRDENSFWKERIKLDFREKRIRCRFLMISRKDILDCTQGMDIERESDGMLATTMIDDDEFRFYVWHERFPDPSKTQPISYTRMSRNPLFYTGSVQF